MTTTKTSPIDLNQTMEQILARYPSAQRALFQRYHVGGCSSCGFEPTDTLAQVCKDHNLLDTTSVVQTILAAHEVDQKMQVDPQQVKAWLDAGESFRFIDVRTPEEIAAAKIPQAEALDYHAPEKYMQLPKDTKIVFSCKSGMRSMDVASYFIGHGFKNVFSMRGGIDGWRQQVDPRIPAC
ncbi:MAG: rhodanese-like domain-containing protein [Planctomycetes bacterium]|nr:rhodanese-like domain-containing protein [Planctomycetota bacterium]